MRRGWTRWFLAALVALWTAAAGAHGGPRDLDPHVHGGAAVKPAQLIALAAQRGRLEAGLAALGLSHLPRRKAVSQALRRMDLNRPDHGAAYDAIGEFRRGAFAGPLYRHWVKAALESARQNAGHTYMQISALEMDEFVLAVRQDGLSLEGVELIVSMSRRKPDLKALETILSRYPEVNGIDILGAETQQLDPVALNGAIDLLLASGRPSPILRIHAGEGYLGDYGAANVNIALRTLVERSAASELGALRLVLAHVARVKDVPAARRDLASLRARGLGVVVNVNPLSNLVYQAVGDVRDISALELGVPLGPGSDNVGSLELNKKIVRLLEAGRGDQAARLSRRFLQGLSDPKKEPVIRME